MENERKKLIKKEKKNFCKFLIMLIIFSTVVANLFVFVENNINNTVKESEEEKEAVVEERVNDYLLLSYEVENKKIYAIQQTMNDNIKVGDKYTVIYNKENPYLINKDTVTIQKTNEESIKSIISIVVTLTIGGIIFAYIKMKRKIAVLQNGEHIKASYLSNKFGMLQLKWKDEKENKIYYFNVRAVVNKIKEGELYDIYMDKNNSKNFLVLLDIK